MYVPGPNLNQGSSVCYYSLSVMVTFLLYTTQEAYNKAKLTSNITVTVKLVNDVLR